MTTIEIRDLNKRFGDVQALDGMSFTVHDGEMYGFVGSNGAGKSTTMRIALGVLAADSGEVLLDGRPLDDDTRRRIGYMPEERGLYGKEKSSTNWSFWPNSTASKAKPPRSAAPNCSRSSASASV